MRKLFAIHTFKDYTFIWLTVTENTIYIVP